MVRYKKECAANKTGENGNNGIEVPAWNAAVAWICQGLMGLRPFDNKKDSEKQENRKRS
jgi:hypothetical protein